VKAQFRASFAVAQIVLLQTNKKILVFVTRPGLLCRDRPPCFFDMTSVRFRPLEQRDSFPEECLVRCKGFHYVAQHLVVLSHLIRVAPTFDQKLPGFS